MTNGPEFNYVEDPFMKQLKLMGWECNTGSSSDPSTTGREDFHEVLLVDDLKRKMREFNLDPEGQPWLDDERLNQAVYELQRLGAPTLMEANQNATKLLLKGTTVGGVEGWEEGRDRTIHFIDWENPRNNEFRAISQFCVKCPPGRADEYIYPDLVLFINGIPVVVVECKKPGKRQGLLKAIDQLQRYSNRRRQLGIVDSDVNEGNEKLFHYSQFQIASNFDHAAVGTFSSNAVHYLAWKDTSPRPLEEIEAEILALEEEIQGMLREVVS